MPEDEVVRDLKKQLIRQGSEKAKSFIRRISPVEDTEGDPMHRVSSHPAMHRANLLYPELGRAGDLAQPGGFRRHHLQQRRPSMDQQSLLNRLLDPRVQRYFEAELKKGRQEEEIEALETADAGGSSNFGTVLLILKSTIGGTLIIIPGAFSHTGLLVAPLLLLIVGGAEIYCMVLLVDCVRSCGGSYGEIARKAVGEAGSFAVEASVFLSQAGFVCAEMLYVAKNSVPPLKAMGLQSWWLSESTILLLQLLVVIPMSWIRQLKYFQVSNLIANVTVALALAILLAYSLVGLADHGPGEGIQLAGPNWMVFAGTVAFSFECINFVIPMYDAHDKKETFTAILVLTLLGVCALFIVFGAVNYAYYGAQTQPVITLNLPRESPVSHFLPLAFALASLFNVPLFLLPAALQLEVYFAGAVDVWKINAMRAILICGCAVISLIGKDSIDAFIALIGSFCCVPLAFIFPVLCHFKLCQPEGKKVLLNVAVLLLGLALFVYTSLSSLNQMGFLRNERIAEFI